MSSRSACVLAVDDNATIRRAIAMRLSSKGYQVVTAEDGPQALAALARQSFDLVLLDLQMPGMRGDEVLQTVRQKYSDTELPVIMLTGSEEKQDITRTLELGANDYVVKPGDLPILLARIHTQLALKAAADKLREHEQFPLGMTAAPLSMTVPPISLSELASDAQASHRRDWSKLRRHSDTFLYDHLPISCLTLNTEIGRAHV
jgi:DNA-binding response OmpR family regulator